MRADHSSGRLTVPDVGPATSRGRTVLTLIRKARRRLLYNELLSEGINATSAGLVAVILLLILGTQVLNWYVAGVTPAVAIAVALYRLRQRAPKLYESAQIVDRRLGLADSLSTAVFFGE